MIDIILISMAAVVLILLTLALDITREIDKKYKYYQEHPFYYEEQK